jgi:hypothetical protein
MTTFATPPPPPPVEPPSWGRRERTVIIVASALPRDVAQALMDSKNCTQQQATVDPASKNYACRGEDGFLPAGATLTRLGAGTIKGDKADVCFHVKYNGEDIAGTIALVKVGGVWKVDDASEGCTSDPEF